MRVLPHLHAGLRDACKTHSRRREPTPIRSFERFEDDVRAKQTLLKRQAGLVLAFPSVGFSQLAREARAQKRTAASKAKVALSTPRPAA